MNNLEKTIKFMEISFWPLAILEMSFFFDLQNLFGLLVLYIGRNIATKVVFRKQYLENYPLACFSVIGFTLSYFFLPLPATLIELKPLNFNLLNPYLTFLHLFITLVAIIFAFKVYTKMMNGNNFLRLFWLKFGVYKSINTAELLALVLISAGSFSFFVLLLGRFNTEIGFQKNVLTSLSIFINLPLLLIFPQFKILNIKWNSTKRFIFVFIYAIFLFIIGIASNVRTSAVFFIGGIFIIYLYLYLTDQVNFKLKKKIIGVLILALWFFTGPFQDISIAMISVRNIKGDMSGGELLNETMSIYKNKDLLNQYKSIVNGTYSTEDFSNNWNEYYLDNTLFSRFCSLKIFDMSIHTAKQVGYGNTRMQDDYEKQFYAMLPEFISKRISGLSKQERDRVAGYSDTDYMYFLSSGNGLGGFRIGSYPGLGLGLFNYFYPLVIVIVLIPSFFLYDSLVLINRKKRVFSLLSIMYLINAFYFLNCGHVYHSDVRFIIRGFWELIIVYILIRTLTYNIFKNIH